MARRLLLAAAASLLVLVVAAGPALACGGLVSANGTIALVRTTTLAAYHNGLEHYVTGFKFVGGGAKFGSIVPLPAVPTRVIREYGERLATITFGNIFEGRVQGRRAAVEIQFFVGADRLQARVERVAAQLKCFGECLLPFAIPVLSQPFFNLLSTGLRLAAVVNFQSLAVVREHEEIIGAGPRALLAPERFQQTEHKRGDTKDF